MTEPLPRCPVCATALCAGPVACPECGALHHPECWDYAGGCAIFGCRGAPRRFPAPPSEFPVLAGAVMAWQRANGLQWSTFQVMHLSLTAGLALLPLLVTARTLSLENLLGLAWGVAVACWSVSVLSAVAWMAAIPVTLLARSALQARLGMSLEPPKGAGGELLDRLRSGRLETARRNARRMLAVLVLACLGSMALELQAGLTPGVLPSVLTLFLGGLLPLGACEAARASEAYMTAFQNRIAATFKDRTPEA